MTVAIKPELTAINTRNSKTAEMLVTEKKFKKVLDYGCGTGRNVKYMADNGEFDLIYGYDIPEQIERSWNNHRELEKNYYEVAFGTGGDTYGKYEAVLNSHVLNVVEEKNIREYIVKDMYSRLNKGGKLFLEVRTKSDVESAKTKEVYKDGYLIKKGKNTATFQKAFTKDEMKKLIEDAGFTIEQHIFNSSNHIVVAVK